MLIKNEDTIKKMFDEISKNYDKLNNIMTLNQHHNIKSKILTNIKLPEKSKVLDLCCGTGDIALDIAAKRKDVEVIGVDFSRKMLDIAEQKAKGISNLRFQEGNAMSLEFEDNSFDACTIGFGLRNVENIEQVIKEMIRVTKVGGYIVNLDTGKPNRIILPIFELFFFRLVPIIGKIFNGDHTPYKYLPESTKDFPSQFMLVEIFKKNGLKNVKRYDFLFGAISMQIGEKSHLTKNNCDAQKNSKKHHQISR